MLRLQSNEKISTFTLRRPIALAVLEYLADKNPPAEPSDKNCVAIGRMQHDIRCWHPTSNYLLTAYIYRVQLYLDSRIAAFFRQLAYCVSNTKTGIRCSCIWWAWFMSLCRGCLSFHAKTSHQRRCDTSRAHVRYKKHFDSPISCSAFPHLHFQKLENRLSPCNTSDIISPGSITNYRVVFFAVLWGKWHDNTTH